MRALLGIRPNEQTNELASILSTADTLVKTNGSGNLIESKSHQINDKTMKFLSLGEEDLSSIMDEVTESVNKMTEEIFCAA